MYLYNAVECRISLFDKPQRFFALTSIVVGLVASVEVVLHETLSADKSRDDCDRCCTRRSHHVSHGGHLRTATFPHADLEVGVDDRDGQQNTRARAQSADEICKDR